MMEMEMNAELDSDESESSQLSSERSSASSTFCNLEKDYARITHEMKSNEALACFEAEYARLYESLYKTHRNEKELSEQCSMLKEEIMEKTCKIYELTKMMKNQEDEIIRLKKEVVNMTKLADAAHTREQNAQEVIENLRLNITKLGLEIDQKNKQLAAEKDITISKQKENLLKERERLLGEMETMRQRMKNMSIYTEELEKKNSDIDHRMNEMQETLAMQLNEVSREKRAREKTEIEVRKLQEEITIKKNELETANATIEVNISNVMRLEDLVKEHKIEGEKMQKEINKLILKKMNLQTDLDNANFEIGKLEKELSDNENLLKNVRYELNRIKQDNAKCKREKDMIDKRLQKIEIERSKLESEHKQTLIDIKNTEREILICRKEQHDNKQHIETLLREKNILIHNKEIIQERVKRLNRELLLSTNSKKKIEQELNTVIQNVEDIKKKIKIIEEERDRYSATVQRLERQIDNYKSAEKLKQVEIFDYKKRLTEAEIKYQQQQSLFDTVRAERNLCNKSLIEAQEELRELKSKLKITDQQIEQMKEDITTKEANLIKKEFLMGKIEKEKEDLKINLRTSHMEISGLRQEIEKEKQEEKRLRQTIHQTDIDVGRLKKNIDNVMNERDILGTQVVRRNDELSLQYSRIKILNKILQRGEAQYNERLEDIRLLKFEVKRLRTEKILLTKNIINASDFRQEIFHLNRDLARERLKVTALEEEIQTPLNIHRWRKLEDIDPCTFELTKKVQILQKRILKLSTAIIDKEKKIQDTEKLNINLRDVLSKQRDPQAVINLNKVQNDLRRRGEKLKCFVAELNIYEAQMETYKDDMARMENTICELKTKYYVQNRKLQKLKEKTSKATHESSLPDILLPNKKFYGGGFNIISTPNYCILNSLASRLNQ